ncbi:MAG: hypothetical protein LBM99_06450 [Bacillales bacterium]|jgi:hypothetical protein|nr:hypothetical protein [Bacillales bacterium]
MKKIIKILFIGLVGILGFSFNKINVKADTTIEKTVKIVTNAEDVLDLESSGLRFRATIPETVEVYGALLLPTTFGVNPFEAYTNNEHEHHSKVLTVLSSEGTFNSIDNGNGTISFSVVLIGIPEAQWGREIGISIISNGVELGSTTANFASVSNVILGSDATLTPVQRGILDTIGTHADREQLFEAEDLINNTNHVRGNPLAHGGYYIGGIDNYGQGVSLNYYAFSAGTREFKVAYTTDSNATKYNVLVNGSFSANLENLLKTGWGAEGFYEPKVATVTITLTAGWNRISVIKNDIFDDNYIELDYFIVGGNNAGLYPYTTPELTSFRVEGEMCKSSGGAPANHGSLSNWFAQGGIENGGYLEAQVRVEETSSYTLRFSYCNGASTGLAVKVNGGATQDINLSASTINAWPQCELTAESLTITLTAGFNTIRIDVNAWITFDYLLFTKV